LSATRHLVLIRHGVTAYNVAGRWQGWSDQPLSDDGVAQAHRLAGRTPTLRPRPDVLFSSDLTRARETARIAFAPTGLEPVATERLRERGFGCWEGLTRDEVRAKYGDARQPEGGEDWDMLRERMSGALAWVLERTPEGGAAAVVGHGGSLKAWVGMALGWDRLDDERSHRLALGNGSVSVVLAEGYPAAPSLRLLRLNDQAHLED